MQERLYSKPKRKKVTSLRAKTSFQVVFKQKLMLLLVPSLTITVNLKLVQLKSKPKPKPSLITKLKSHFLLRKSLTQKKEELKSQLLEMLILSLLLLDKSETPMLLMLLTPLSQCLKICKHLMFHQLKKKKKLTKPSKNSQKIAKSPDLFKCL